MDALESYIEEQRQAFGVPGMSMAVVQDGKVALSRGFGLRDVAQQKPVTEDTVFPIASVTKAFTATTLAMLVDEGLLSWDEPVRRRLPTLRFADPVVTEHVTPRDLLCHNTGLPRHDLLWWSRPDTTAGDLLERLPYLPPSRTFRQAFQYSNLVYQLAGHLVAEVSGTTWEEAVRTRLLEPLGMTSTAVLPGGRSPSGDDSRCHVERDGAMVEVPYLDVGAAAAAGGLCSSAPDMARWLLCNLEDGRVDDEEVVPPSVLAAAHSPAMHMAEESQWEELSLTAYGLGWRIGTYRGHRLLVHGGETKGAGALVAFMPSARTGGVVLTNAGGTVVHAVVLLRAFDQALGLDPLPWADRYREMKSGMEEAARRAQASRPPARDLPPSHPLEDYVGEYHHPGYGCMTVSLEDGELQLRLHELTFVSTHRHHDSWDLVTEMGTNLPLRFETDFDGEVIALFAGVEPAVPAIRFEKRRTPTTKES